MVEQDQTSPPLGQVWQLPVLALSLITFGVGLWLASSPEADAESEGGGLDRLARQVDAGRYEEAWRTAEGLAARIENIPHELHDRFYLLKGDAASLRQRGLAEVEAEDHQQVVAAYRRARELGAELDVPRAGRKAESLAALGDLEAALAVLDDVGAGGAEGRQRLLRRPIERALAEPSDVMDGEAIRAAIDRLLAEEHLSVEHEVWATARQADLLMRGGEAERAIDMLLRRLARLQGTDDAPVGELKLKLAQAYLSEAEMANAERWLLRAQQRLDSDDVLNGQAVVALGQIRFAEGNAAEAVEHFAAAAEQYAETDVYPEALLGKAESEARLGRHERALEAYGGAADLVRQGAGRGIDLHQRLVDSLEGQYGRRFGQGEYEQALAYLAVEERLHAEPPERLLLNAAVAHHRLAGQLAGEPEDELERGLDPEAELAAGEDEALERDVARRVAGHRAAAADAYLAYAEQVIATDDEAYGQSLWMAGRLYDQAGLHREAVRVFDRYIEQRPEDPRRLRASFRLAQAHQADGRPGEAVALYTQLVEDHPNAPEAYASLVPLAQSYLARGPEYTDRAEQVLLSVVTDHEALRPESAEFRAALIELGQLYYRRGDEGDYEKAIARLSEVVERYGRDEPMPELLFKLGDAYRKSVQQLDQELEAALPPAQRAELGNERATRLHEAREQFDRVILAYEERAAGALSRLQRLYLRNSYFYRADCAYELGHYEGPEGSIALYEKAVQRYDKDPAALVGLVQIVNSYAELGAWEKARTANERAKVYLDAIPEEAFDDPDLPMNRDHWQRWLDWTTELTLGEG